MGDNPYDNVDEVFDTDDFVFTKKDGHFVGGGYKLNSIFLNQGISPITTLNEDIFDLAGSVVAGGGKSKKGKFDQMAVPAGLFYINQQPLRQDEITYEKKEPLSEDMFDKLFELVNGDKKKQRATKRNKSKLTTEKRKTKRHK